MRKGPPYGGNCKKKFFILDLVQIWKNGTTFSKKGEYRKKCKKSPIHSLLTPADQWGFVQKFCKFASLLSLIWAFRKSTWEVDMKKSIFSYRRYSQTVALKSIKKIEKIKFFGCGLGIELYTRYALENLKKLGSYVCHLV